MIRLAKRISESGVASRREAEKMIKNGLVKVDGNVILTPVFFVNKNNVISVNNKVIPSKNSEICIWKMNKPKGYITTKSDPKGRKTVFDLFPKISDRIIYIGRLDINSEGLLLFTNNGDISRKLELPSTGLIRTYKVRFFGKLSENVIQSLNNGIIINKIQYGSIKIKISEQNNTANNWATITLKEGKNREIRKVLEHFNCHVNRLIRISYGPIKLDKLHYGKIQKLSNREVQNLLKIIS